MSTRCDLTIGARRHALETLWSHRRSADARRNRLKEETSRLRPPTAVSRARPAVLKVGRCAILLAKRPSGAFDMAELDTGGQRGRVKRSADLVPILASRAFGFVGTLAPCCSSGLWMRRVRIVAHSLIPECYQSLSVPAIDLEAPAQPTPRKTPRYRRAKKRQPRLPQSATTPSNRR
jgi:hypothetical protein